MSSPAVRNNPTVLQRPGFAFETILGDATTPTTQILSLDQGFDVKPNPELARHQPAGVKRPDRFDLNREWGTFSGKMSAPSYGDVGWVLKNYYGNPSSTNLTGAYSHVYNSNDLVIDTLPSLSIEVGSAQAARLAAGGYVNNINFTSDRTKSVEFDLSGTCQKITAGTRTSGNNAVQTLTILAVSGNVSISYKGATATFAYNANAATIQTALRALATIGSGNLTVTGTGPFTLTAAGALAGQPMELFVSADTSKATVALTTQGGLATFNQVPILPGDVQVSFADSLTGLSNSPTLSSAHFSTSGKFDRKRMPIWFQNSAAASYNEVVEEGPDESIEFEFPFTDDLFADVVAKMRAQTIKYVRIKWTSATQIGSSGYYYSLCLDVAVRPEWTDVPGIQGVVGAKFTGHIVTDAASGFSHRWTLVTDASTY